MIVSLFSDLVKGPLFQKPYKNKENLKTISPEIGLLFNKLALPIPESPYVDSLPTREQGLLVFNNETACAIRLYPHQSDLGSCENIYHPDALPPIGLIRLAKFTTQLMPGIEIVRNNKKNRIDAEFQKGKFSHETGNDCDSNYYNLGHKPYSQKRKLILLDTILDGEDLYLTYNPGLYLDEYLQATEHYSQLQRAFYNAWTSDDPAQMAAFWQTCKAAKQKGLLHTGWNNYQGAANVKAISARYTKRSWGKWKTDTTRRNSLRLLPFGPDRVGEKAARAAFRY